MKYINAIIISFELLLFLSFFGTPWGYLTFGMGLGDLFFVWTYALVLLIHFVWTAIITMNKAEDERYGVPTFIFGACFLIEVLLLFSARGTENHQLFYVPCRTELYIQNNKGFEKVEVSMCTGDYTSELVVIWNKPLMTIVSGEITMPPALKVYAKQPVKQFHIYLDKQKYVTDETFDNHSSDTDALVPNNKYKLRGQIRGIAEGLPYMHILSIDSIGSTSK